MDSIQNTKGLQRERSQKTIHQSGDKGPGKSFPLVPLPFGAPFSSQWNQWSELKRMKRLGRRR